MTSLENRPILSSEQKNIRPDFIIIGAMKCGTTSLHYYLNCHPEISMSLQKELDFFIEERNWDQGINWYQSQFKDQEGIIYGEASPHYTAYPQFKGVPERLYATLPHAKLIYIIRDPIERILSQYIHLYADGRENRDIEQALFDFENNPHNPYVCRSRYYLQLKQYLPYFSPEQILLVTTEDLATYPQETLKRIFRFLGINENFDMKKFVQKKLHQTKDKRRKTALGNFVSKLPIIYQIENLPPALRFRLNKMIYKPLSQSIEKPILSQKLYNQLLHYFHEDLKNLMNFINSEKHGNLVSLGNALNLDKYTKSIS